MEGLFLVIAMVAIVLLRIKFPASNVKPHFRYELSHRPTGPIRRIKNRRPSH